MGRRAVWAASSAGAEAAGWRPTGLRPVCVGPPYGTCSVRSSRRLGRAPTRKVIRDRHNNQVTEGITTQKRISKAGVFILSTSPHVTRILIFIKMRVLAEFQLINI